VPESLGKDPADYFRDEMNFRQDDDIREGDWILCWECKNDGKPKKNCHISWLRVHHVIPNGADEVWYTKLVTESKNLAQGIEPFVLDEPTKGYIRQALQCGISPKLATASVEDEEWSLPPIEYANEFLTHVQELAGSRV
jgi:hypothetical protein